MKLQSTTMKNTKISIIVILIMFFSIPNLCAQKILPDDRDVIAGNIEQLMENFTASLSFEITIDNEEIKQIDAQLNSLNDSTPQQFIDSIRTVKIDSLKEIERNKLREKFLNNFVLDGDVPTGTIWNFAFDTVIVPKKSLGIVEFSEMFFGLYNKIDGDKITPKYKFQKGIQSTLLWDIDSLPIEMKDGFYNMFIPIQIGFFTGTYDTVGAIFKKLPGEDQKYLKGFEYFSTRAITDNIKLSAIVQFKSPDDINRYRIKSLNSLDKEAIQMGDYTTPLISNDLKLDLDSILNEEFRILEKLEMFLPLHPLQKNIDTTCFSNLLELFDNPDKESIQCTLFFTDSICDIITEDTGTFTNITAKQYCDIALKNYKIIRKPNIKMIPDELQIKNGDGYDIVKVPAKMTFKAEQIDNLGKIALVNLLDDSIITNIYCKLGYKKRIWAGKSNKVKYLDAKITDIAAYDKTIVISRPDRKGSFSLSANYSPFYHQFLINKGTGFKDFTTQFYPSHSFGLEGGYYWFGKNENRLLGVSVGLYYDMIKSGIYVDTVYYANAYTGTQNPTGEHVEKYEEQVWLSDFSQTIKFNQISIPVQFNYMTRMQSQTLFNLSIGGRISFIGKGSVETKQEEGTFTRKGYYEIKFPDGTDGSYVLEDIEDAPYYYFTNKNIAYVQEHPENDLNTTAVYLQVNPSFAIPISEKNKQLYLNLGLNFQYGLTPLYNNNESSSIMGAADESNSGFVYGIKDQNYAFGITIGIRYFNALKEQEDEEFHFK